MTNIKLSPSFSPMTFKQYITNFFRNSCNKDGNNWGWFIDIDQNDKNDNKIRLHSPINHNKFYNIKQTRSFANLQSENDLLFIMDDTTITKKITYNIIGLSIICLIYIILL